MTRSVLELVLESVLWIRNKVVPRIIASVLFVPRHTTRAWVLKTKKKMIKNQIIKMMKWCNKILNSPKLRTEEQQQDGQVSLQDEDFIAGEPQLVDNKKLPNIVQEDEEFLSTSTGSSSKARISEIIELKLLIANQQAAIDTLSYKLHNLELAHHRLELDASKR